MPYLPEILATVAVGLLAAVLVLLRRLRRKAVEVTQRLEGSLEGQRSRAATKAVHMAHLEGMRASPLHGLLTRRLGIIEALAGAIARDLEQALAAAPERLIPAAQRSAARAGKLAWLASGGRAAEPQTALGTIWPRVRQIVAPLVGEGHTIQSSFADALPPVRGTGEEWVQVLAALVENALVAMPSGGIVEAAAALLPSGTVVRVWVRDTGTGIRPDALTHVLEPFFTSRADNGAEGIGLALVAALIEGMGGQVEVASKLGEGTTVTVEVPVAQPAAAAEQLRLEGVYLVADDDAEIRTRIGRMLKSFGADALEVDSGTAARARFASEPSRFAGAVLDVVMPGTPVGDVVADMRRRRGDFPVLLVSGYDTMQSVDAILALGGVRFLRKPFAREELHRALGDLVAVGNG